jgi:glutathione S-transferase
MQLQRWPFTYEASPEFYKTGPRAQVPYAMIDGKLVSDSDNIIDALEVLFICA